MELNEKLLAKAKEAKTLEELTILAKENNIELTEEEATAYFNQLHPCNNFPEYSLTNLAI